MVKVKICGMTDLRDALKAHELGGDLVGFVFYEGSPRKVDPEHARVIIEDLPRELKKVGLFLDQDAGTVRYIAKRCRLDVLQLHGSESPEYCKSLAGEDHKIMKAFRVKDAQSVENVNNYKEAVDYYLFDTYVKGVPGGTGKTFNWDIIAGKKFDKPFFLAGGLNPKNVTEAILRTSPYAVDVASGVEKAPGRKDFKLLKEFMDNAKKV